MKELKEEIYQNLAKPGKRLIAWSGGPYSSLIWWLAYKDLGLEIPLLFVDDGEQEVNLYSHIAKVRKEYKLPVITAICEPKQVMIELAKRAKLVDTLFTGKKLEFGYCPFERNLNVWNLLKTLNIPFYSKKKSMLG